MRLAFKSAGGATGRDPQQRTLSSARMAQSIEPDTAMRLATRPVGTGGTAPASDDVVAQQVTAPPALRTHACASAATISSASTIFGVAPAGSPPQHWTTVPFCGLASSAHANARPTVTARALSPAGAALRMPPCPLGPHIPKQCTLV